LKRPTLLLFAFISITICTGFIRWGFFGHRLINRVAIFTLPNEMIGFYKHHIQYITENAINPDRRRYAVDAEAARHYIDLDIYGDSAIFKMPRYWKDAVLKYTEDTLQTYGIVPWHINRVRFQLTDAMKICDASNILRLSADLGHYIADANVPLHTTENYNGQLTDQYGIHGFWESRLPELFSQNYDLFTGKATYLENTQISVWKAVETAHLALDSVLGFEKSLSQKIRADKQYIVAQRGQSNIKTYSVFYSKSYHTALDGMVERQMKSSIKLVGDMWYTCWVDAGQPNLDSLINYEFSEEELSHRKEELQQWKEANIFKSRVHEH
jgi:hypothetical protein